MILNFIASDSSYNLKSICSFQEETEGEFFRESLFMLYPNIDKDTYSSLESKEEKSEFLIPYLTDIYNGNVRKIKDKSCSYQKYWNNNQGDIQRGLETVFETSLSNIFNDMQARVGINPAGPRYLNEKAFEIIHLYSPQGAALISLHEIIHFIWFHVWQKHFKDSSDEYENPHLKWVFSEMVPDMIMKKAGLQFLNPQNKETIYPYFNEIRIHSELILDVLNKLFQENDIIYFMEKGLEICMHNEKAIRAVMY